VVADRRLGEPERGNEVAHASLAGSRRLDQADELEPGRVRDGPQNADEGLGIGPPERSLGQRRPAGLLSRLLAWG
jgi:hypothetical protein